MSHEFRIGGILISTIVPAFLAALVLMMIASWLLVRVRFYRLVWHRPLVDLAILVILFCAIVLLLPDGWPAL